MLVPPDNFGLVEPGVYRCSKLDADNFPFLETLQLNTILLLDAENPPRPLKHFIANNSIDLINLGGLKVTNHNHTGENNRSSNREDDDKASLNDRSLRKTSSSGSISSSHSSPNDSRTGSVLGSRNASPVLSSQASVKEINLQLINLSNPTKKNDQWMLIEKNLIKRAFEIILNKTKYNILIVDSTSTLVSILRKIQKWNFNSIVNEFRIYHGNSAKSNYFAENFLELIDIELIPYEIEQLNQVLKIQQQQQQKVDEIISKSPELHRTASINQGYPLSLRTSIDDENTWEGMIDDDDIDDDLLSASPQIPENLLKIVEKKRNNLIELSDDDKIATPGSSPRYSASNPNNSPMNTDGLTNAAKHYWDKRRPSIDAKIIRPIHNTKFRNSFNGVQLPLSSRSSFENINSPQVRRVSKTEKRPSLRIEDYNEFEQKKLREKHDFKYYKNINKHNVSFDNVGYIKLKLPASHKLPEWFIRGRDFWEESFRKLNV